MTRRRAAGGGRSSTARAGTAARGTPSSSNWSRAVAPTTTAKRGARRGRRRGTFGRKAQVHRPAAVAGTAAVDEYVTIGRKVRLHRHEVVAVAVNEYVTLGRKAQLHPPAAVVAAAAVSEYSTRSGRCTASRRLPWSPCSRYSWATTCSKAFQQNLSHEMSEDQGLADLSRQLDEVCSPLNSINNNELDLTQEVSEDQGLADLSW